jgi:hypothetical protein
MNRAVFLTATLALGLSSAVAAQEMAGPPDLSCIEALKAVDEASLAGLFSFISPKDTPKAFGDLIMHNKNVLKKFVAKAQKDSQMGSGAVAWNREVLQFALSIYDSPLKDTLVKPGVKLVAQMRALAGVPAGKA